MEGKDDVVELDGRFEIRMSSGILCTDHRGVVESDIGDEICGKTCYRNQQSQRRYPSAKQGKRQYQARPAASRSTSRATSNGGIDGNIQPRSRPSHPLVVI